ncbi:hypothetical protein [Wenzhouxiangella sp. EGI_FJ10305]|uniref:hypothetical protein n=1 Tax=Wenzhouxiangella sp. EGI_FJ10305 TaxID=3243768 RepID=UPI0035DD0962
MNAKHFSIPCATVLALTLAAPAGASVTEEERDILEAFYQAANGDEWHRNYRWLQPGSDPCTWYGVNCAFRGDIGRDIVSSVELPGNNLSGTLDTRIFEIVHNRLDLSDNLLGGTLDHLPGSPGEVDLSRNRFVGELPTGSSAVAGQVTGGPPSGNWFLDLSSNDFEGEVPSGWSGRSWLSLANNRLEGLPMSLLDGSKFSNGQFLDLSDNNFSGALPTTLMEGNFMPHNGPSRWGGGLNLCWNDWAVPESVEFRDWLRSRHVGGEFESCLSAERQPLDPAMAISGSWFDPDRNGEGIVVQALDNGTVLNYVFTFDEDGHQQWLVGAESPNDNNISWRELLRTQGRFGTGLLEQGNAMQNRGSFRLDRLDADRILTERVYIDETSNACILPYPPVLNCFGDSLSDRLEYRQLSQLAGTTCENQSPFQQYAGAWYNPESSGEGFLVEVLPDHRIVAYWFTYQPDDSGRQAWMVGDGSFVDKGVVLAPAWPWQERAELKLYQPTGGSFGHNFDPDDVQLVEWGDFIIEFNDEDTGRVEWNSNIDGYGSGEYPIERLAQPKLADCD